MGQPVFADVLGSNVELRISFDWLKYSKNSYSINRVFLENVGLMNNLQYSHITVAAMATVLVRFGSSTGLQPPVSFPLFIKIKSLYVYKSSCTQHTLSLMMEAIYISETSATLSQ
jgi:hypothetical protein